MSNRAAFYKLALNGLYCSGAHHFFKERFAGVGSLLTLHHVKPQTDAGLFAPNRILSITPEFLEACIVQVRDLGYEIVSLHEARRRLVEKDFASRFVSFTLDDGYADNYLHAFPVFRRHEVPFTIYLCSGVMEASIDLWWQALEDIIGREPRVTVSLNGETREFETRSTSQKYSAYEEIYWALRGMPIEEQLDTFQAIKGRYGHVASPDDLAMTPLSWSMVDEMLGSGLLTVGAHTVNHLALSKLSPDDVAEEIRLNQSYIEKHTGVWPDHFAYPYGDALSAAGREFAVADDLGFKTAVTTRKGVLFPEHSEHLNALPRISLNGDYQQLRNVRLFMSGVPFALFNGFRRLDVA
jgi:peptidoglycan/xylan/chitin deacetylase (PgdA/CDA1 family)